MTDDLVRTDPNLPVDDEWAATVCKVGQGASCCRYLGRGPKGWGCLKSDPELGPYLDARAVSGTMGATSINCTGRRVN